MKSSLSWMAGLVVVGDEILSGKVEDSNISFLCTKMYEIGWTVRKVGRGRVGFSFKGVVRGFRGWGLCCAAAGQREFSGPGTDVWKLPPGCLHTGKPNVYSHI